MRRGARLAWFVLLVAASPLAAAETGAINGRIDRPERVKAINVVDRGSGQKYSASIERSGRFRVPGLPLDKAYDLLIDCGRLQVEGVSLNVPRSDYEEEQPLTGEDVATLKKLTRSLNQFENHVDVLAVRGNSQHAAVLVNKLRTEAFVNSPSGEVIWRLELWHFERPDEHWIKVQDELFIVLHRERIQRSVYERHALVLDPGLGGLTPTAAHPAINVSLVKLPEATPGVRLIERGKGGEDERHPAKK